MISYYLSWYCTIHGRRVPDGEGCEECIDQNTDEALDEQESDFWVNTQPVGGFDFGDYEAIFYGE